MGSKTRKEKTDMLNKQGEGMSFADDPTDKEGIEVDEAAYVAKSEATLNALFKVMNIKKPE